MAWRRRRRSGELEDKQLWDGVDADGNGYVMFAEMTTDPELAEAAEKVKQVLRESGLTQIAGD